MYAYVVLFRFFIKSLLNSPYVTYLSFIKSGLKFTKAAHTTRISSNFFSEATGTVPARILNTFSLLIALSTWILQLAILLVLVTSLADNCCLLFVNAGIYSFTFLSNISSAIVNPLSTIIASPCFK